MKKTNKYMTDDYKEFYREVLLCSGYDKDEDGVWITTIQSMLVEIETKHGKDFYKSWEKLSLEDQLTLISECDDEK